MSPSNQALQQQKIHCDASLWEKIANPSYSKNTNKYIVMLLGYWAMPATVRKASVLVEAQNGVFSFLYSISEWQRKEIWKIEIEELQHKKWSRLTQNCVCRGYPPPPPLSSADTNGLPQRSACNKRGVSAFEQFTATFHLIITRSWVPENYKHKDVRRCSVKWYLLRLFVSFLLSLTRILNSSFCCIAHLCESFRSSDLCRKSHNERILLENILKLFWPFMTSSLNCIWFISHYTTKWLSIGNRVK